MKKMKINGTRVVAFFSFLLFLYFALGNVPRADMLLEYCIFAIFCICTVYIAEEKTNISRSSNGILEKKLQDMRKDIEKAYADEVAYISAIARKDVGLFNSADMIPMQVLARLKTIDAEGHELQHFLQYYSQWVGKTIEQALTYNQLKVIFHNAGIDDCANSQYVRVIGKDVKEELIELQEAILREYGKDIRTIVAKDWETAPEDRKVREWEEVLSSSKKSLFWRAGVHELVPQATA